MVECAADPPGASQTRDRRGSANPSGIEPMHVNPLRQAVDQLEKLSEYRLFGRVASIMGMLVEVGGVERQLSIGDRCHLLARGGRRVPCEVVGFRRDRAVAM